MKPIVFTFSFTGLRPQELIALEWRHVNLEQKTISVKQAIKRTVTRDEKIGEIVRGARIGGTKTPKSVRTIAIPDIVVEVLVEWRDYCTTHNIHSAFVFSTKTGQIRTYSGLRSMLVRFVERHNLQDEGISRYTFRRTFATILLEERENPRIVADLMGHVKVSTTLDIYSHVVNNAVYEKTAKTLDGVFQKLYPAPLLSTRGTIAVIGHLTAILTATQTILGGFRGGKWSHRRESNPLPHPYQGCALPSELRRQVV